MYLASYRGKGKEKADEAGWELCAAKRMNPDRESQTMGLREAFFLNRLKSHTRGMYIVKLIAVREHSEKRHTRSASDFKVGRPRGATDLSSFPSMPLLNAPRSVLILEHVPLGTLDQFLRTSRDLVGSHIWLRWARQCSEAVAWTHEKGILHADIKPANLLVSVGRGLADSSSQLRWTCDYQISVLPS